MINGPAKPSHSLHGLKYGVFFFWLQQCWSALAAQLLSCEKKRKDFEAFQMNDNVT